MGIRDLLIVLIVFGALPFILTRPFIGVLVWSWLAYMNPHRLGWGFARDLPLSAITAAFLLIGVIVSRERKTMPWTPVTVVWAMFVFWLIVTTIFAMNQEWALLELKKTLKIQFLTLIALLLLNSRKRLDIMIWVIVGSIGFFGVKGGIFTLLTGGQYKVWGPPNSFIEGNNEIALALILIMPLARYLQLQATRPWVKWMLTIFMILCGLAIVGTYSRGALLAGGVMAITMWFKSRRRFVLAIALFAAVGMGLSFMPEQWMSRMDTISEYEEDASAMGRINAWWFAFNLAKDSPIVGGGFQVFTPELFYIYAPEPEDFHDAHSIYFEILGEQGFVGLFLFLLLWFLSFRTASWVIKNTKDHENLRWSQDLAGMLQVSLLGYGAGGAFLGLAYFDLPYHMMALIVAMHVLVTKELNGSGTSPDIDEPVKNQNQRVRRTSR